MAVPSSRRIAWGWVALLGAARCQASPDGTPGVALRGNAEALVDSTAQGHAEDRVATADAATCTLPWDDCRETRCCQAEGMLCYEKDQFFAQCRPNCIPENDDADGWSCTILTLDSAPTPAPPPTRGAQPPSPAPAPPSVGPERYQLDWEAKGTAFFEGFNFLTSDGNHGASHYLPSVVDAEEAGVVEAHATHAILRAGKRSSWKYKRETAKIGTKKAWKHFLAAVKYSHVPYGCGVWPAFFTLGTGDVWPMAGEMDILEYVNDAGSMTSFHTGKQCKLNAEEVNRYKPMPDANLLANNGSNYNCHTAYCDTCTSLGCAPNILPLYTGMQWANRPGVLAMQRTEAFTKIFYIPEGDIPGELEGDAPRPDGEWDRRWLISYYPFGASSECPEPDDVMGPQQFIFSIAFCGDWASKVWGASPTCTRTGPAYNASASEGKLPIAPEQRQCRAVDPLAEYAPAEDCCTQYIADEHGEYDTDAALRSSAFFNISWFKVFT